MKQAIIILLKRRHFWRYATFSEVGKLYVAQLMRTIAVNIGAAFMSVYLFKSGYELWWIAAFWAVYRLFKITIAIPCAAAIAHIGPKHAILVANILYIPAMLLFTMLTDWGVWVMWFVAIFQGVSATLHEISHKVNFSKIKSAQVAGRQMAYMDITERVAKAASPLIGGMIALWIDPRATLMVSIVLFMFAAWPLLRTDEPVQTKQALRFRGFPWRETWRSLVGELALGYEVTVTIAAWPLFLIGVVFVSGDNHVYAAVGMLSSVVYVTSIVASRAYGQLIDRHAGGALLRWSSMAAGLVHVVRAFAVHPAMAVAVNVVHEVTATGYNMAFMRGIFDTADRSGRRVLYLTLIEIMAALGGALAMGFLAVLLLLLPIQDAFMVLFLVASMVAFAMSRTKFRIYR
ncbi:MAG: hypothetical protein Q4A34_01180 [Candidatus Saccharibacteria bacterium]|nr:hypothetical protein [Candidatus Saccharibacteria bacterium]